MTHVIAGALGDRAAIRRDELWWARGEGVVRARRREGERVRANRDWFWLEILVLLGVLASGAAARYWLSTALPFSSEEMAALGEASVRNHSLRVPFMMLNGASLFAFYVFVRRSAGPETAFALLLLLQTSLTFQVHALRIRWASVGIMALVLAVTYWRLWRPATRAPRPLALGLAVLALLLAARGLYLGATLPQRLETIQQQTAADPERLRAALIACGGGTITALAKLEGCALDWPESRSLGQQEALLQHAQTLGEAARPMTSDWKGAGAAADRTTSERDRVAIFDEQAVALFVVERGPDLEIALRIVKPR